MQNKLALLFFAGFISAFYSFCTNDSSNNANTQGADAITLESELLTPGNSVELATATGGTVSGVTTDTNGDNSADGLDFNADANLDVIYLEGTLSKTWVKTTDSFAFRMAGSDTTFYFRTDGESIQIFSDEEGTSVEVTIVTGDDGTTIVGVNTTGGEEADIVFEVPLYVGGNAAVVLTIPTSGSTIGSFANIVITFSEAMITSSINLSGNMVTEYGPPTKSFNTSGTTLTLSPGDGWPPGNQSFSVTGTAVSGHSLPARTLTYQVDGTAPLLIGGEPTPVEYTDISYSTVKVKFVFNETIDPASVSVSVFGSNYTNFDIVTTNVSNDTVRIIPDGSWNCLYDDEFTVIASDIFGNSNIYGPFLYGFCGGQ